MDIVKLADILIDTPKYGAPLSALKIGKYKYLRQTDIESKQPTMFVDIHNNCFLEKGDLLISRAGMNAGTPYIHSTNEKWVYAGYLVKYNINEELADTKFIYYFLLKNIKNIKKIANAGSTMPKLNPPAAKKIEIKLPTLVEQQYIIDIIEPFEILVELVFKKIKINEKIAELIINNFYRKNGLFKENEIEFFKGINFKKGMISENNSDILFINVSAINNKPNKFIKLEYINMINVFEGDVVLSLDGNTGLVNNCLKGINGYGYKIASNKIKNSQIYYSLLSKINQDIIDQNSFGTTIQHASKSKDKIILLNFSENQKILDIFFDLEIIYKKKAKLLKKIISSLIEIYTR